MLMDGNENSESSENHEMPDVEANTDEENLEGDLYLGNAMLDLEMVHIRDDPISDPLLLQRLSMLETISGKMCPVPAYWPPFFTAMLLSPGNFK